MDEKEITRAYYYAKEIAEILDYYPMKIDKMNEDKFTFEFTGWNIITFKGNYIRISSEYINWDNGKKYSFDDKLGLKGLITWEFIGKIVEMYFKEFMYNKDYNNKECYFTYVEE